MQSGVGERRETGKKRERERKGGEKRESVSEQVIMGSGPREVRLTVLAAPLIFARCVTQGIFLNFETQ